jgi:chromosome segregation ATPase
VSQPGLAFGFWSSDEPSRPEQGKADGTDLTLPIDPDDYQSLLDELAQAQALDHERVARIYHLEQALDQALACLDDLKLQVHDQEFLEAQLAATEEFAYVQQQAIARLKLQLTQQRQTLDAQTVERQERDQGVQALLDATEVMAQAQQAELDRLRSRLAQDQADVEGHRHRLEKQLEDLKNAVESRQQRILELESVSLSSRTLNASLEVQLETAQQQVRQLCASLSQHQASLANLEAQLAQAHLRLEEQQQSAAHLSRRRAGMSEDNPTIAALQQDLSMAQVKVEELETQLAKQVKLQARWQQSCQELDTERDRYQSRIESLEREVAEMQEQILQQARQTSEYETAIQHWKDRYLASQQQMIQLKELLEQTLPQLPTDANPDITPIAALSELLAAVHHLLTSENADSTPLPALPSPRFNALDLPDFLMRRRTYRSK